MNSLRKSIKKKFVDQCIERLDGRFSVTPGSVVTANEFPNLIGELNTFLRRIQRRYGRIPSRVQREAINLLDKMLAATEDVRNVYAPSNSNFDNHWRSLGETLSLIDDDAIQSSSLSYYMKTFLLSRKHNEEPCAQIAPDDDSNFAGNGFPDEGAPQCLEIDAGRLKWVIRVSSIDLCDLSRFPAVIDIINPSDDFLTIEGYYELPASVEISIQPIALLNGKEIPAEAIDRLDNKYVLDKPYRKKHGFKLSLQYGNEVQEVQFGYRIDKGLYVRKRISFSWLSPISADSAYQYLNLEEGILIASKTALSLIPINKATVSFIERLREVGLHSVASNERAYLENLTVRTFYRLYHDRNNAELLIRIEALFDSLKHFGCSVEEPLKLYERHIQRHKLEDSSIWVIMDRPMRADDNGEAFFRYMTSIKLEQPSIYPYFVLSESAPGYNELKSIGTIISPFSLEHRMLHVVADYVISSQMQEFVHNPFNSDFGYMRDLCNKPRYIFLQHGVIHNYHGPTIGKYGRNFSGFVTSAPAEREYILSPYLHYNEEQVWLTGLPRFDRLYDKPKKVITIMPTWRQWLTERVFDEEQNTKIWKVKEQFSESSYFKFYQQLLTNKRLLGAASSAGYRIQFQLHVNFLPVAHLFEHSEIVDVNMGEKRYRDIFAESSLVVTDYSSAVFDFAYLRKPIIYAQFDKDAFYANHSVKHGYFDFERDGFGEVTYNLDDCIDMIISYLENDCSMRPEHLERINKFFPHADRKCCERVYTYILNDMVEPANQRYLHVTTEPGNDSPSR